MTSMKKRNAEIVALVGNGRSIPAVAKQFGLTASRISQIVYTARKTGTATRSTPAAKKPREEASPAPVINAGVQASGAGREVTIKTEIRITPILANSKRGHGHQLTVYRSADEVFNGIRDMFRTPQEQLVERIQLTKSDSELADLLASWLDTRQAALIGTAPARRPAEKAVTTRAPRRTHATAALGALDTDDDPDRVDGGESELSREADGLLGTRTSFGTA